MFLNDPEAVANILEKLLSGSKVFHFNLICPLHYKVLTYCGSMLFQDDALLAFQIAFDLVENENQAFLLNVRNRLPTLRPQSPIQGNPNPESTLPSSQNGTVGADCSVAAEDVHMSVDSQTPNGNARVVDPNEVAYADRLAKIKGILSGEMSIQLTLQFLYSHNR